MRFSSPLKISADCLHLVGIKTIFGVLNYLATSVVRNRSKCELFARPSIDFSIRYKRMQTRVTTHLMPIGKIYWSSFADCLFAFSAAVNNSGRSMIRELNILRNLCIAGSQLQMKKFMAFRGIFSQSIRVITFSCRKCIFSSRRLHCMHIYRRTYYAMRT